MKQFNKYGVAAAVAATATSAFAQVAVFPGDVAQSDQNLGDAAIVPYYNVMDGRNTGLHIVNTTDLTQVVKVRLRRATDSLDALDFDIVMSPDDVWVGSIQEDQATGGVRILSNDTTCTVPEFVDGILDANEVGVYQEDASEGYIEVIGMAQADATQPISVNALHDATGVPADCAAVRENFLRVDDPDFGIQAVPGVHHSALTSDGSELSNYEDTFGRALKVSWFIRDSGSSVDGGGMEIGGNAVHIENFAAAPMMTNQVGLVFSSQGELMYDPFNFELPNLNQGSYPASAGRVDSHDGEIASDCASLVGNALEACEAVNRTLFNPLREALGSVAILNEWSDREARDGSGVLTATVNTDWVVTFPGQYTMVDPICTIYDNYTDFVQDNSCATTRDSNELPFYLVENSQSELFAWDREEQLLVDQDNVGVVVSPSGSVLEDDLLENEVNVLVWSQDENSAGVLDSGVAKVVTLDDGADNAGWGGLILDPQPADADQFVLRVTGRGTGDTDSVTSGSLGDVTPYVLTGNFIEEEPLIGNTIVMGMSVWERRFQNNAAANYGRAVEHSHIKPGVNDLFNRANVIELTPQPLAFGGVPQSQAPFVNESF